MGIGKRVFATFLCDGCGREVITEENTTTDGYFLEIMEVRKGESLGTDNVFACSLMCVQRAVHDALHRETLPEDEKLAALQELWLRGRVFVSHPELPVYDAADETRVIGSARELEPPTDPRRPSPRPLERRQ